jgi:putative flippase GtrA
MYQIHQFTRNLILQFIDFFYPLFKKIMPLQTFRYAACGGFNTVLSIVLYTVAYNYIFTRDTIQIRANFALSRHIAADYLFAFWIAFPIGFYLSRYVVFQESSLPKNVQLFRYFIVTCGAMGLNYIFLKFFVEALDINGPIAKIFTTVFVIAFSYFSQRNFSFKEKIA